MSHFFPVIDLEATGKNIIRLRTERNLTVRDLQAYFGFAEPNAIYHWQQGKSLPSVDNLYALSELLGVTVNDILVPKPYIRIHEQQAAACCSNFVSRDVALLWKQQTSTYALLRRTRRIPLWGRAFSNKHKFYDPNFS